MLDFDPTKDYYKILGLTQNSTDKQIKEAYYKLARKHHPDLNAGKTTETFKEMSAAYDILGDINKRKQYDSYRQTYSNPFSSGFSGSSSKQNTYANTKTDNSNYNPYSQNYYRKTSQWQTKGDFKGNPFFKDFEDFIRTYEKQREEQFKNYTNTKYNQTESDPYEKFKGRSSFGGFNNKNDFNNFQWERNRSYYNPYESEIRKRFIIKWLIFAFIFMWLLSFSARRKNVIYISDEFSPHGNINFVPRNGIYPSSPQDFKTNYYPNTNVNQYPFDPYEDPNPKVR